MKYTIELDKQDIANIISKYFSTNPDQVDIKIITETEGYGTIEHQVEYVKAEVVFDKQVVTKISF